MVAGSIFFASFSLLEPSFFAEVSLLELFFPELSALELMVSIYLLTGDGEKGVVLSVVQDDVGRRSGTVVIVTGGDDLCFSG